MRSSLKKTPIFQAIQKYFIQLIFNSIIDCYNFADHNSFASSGPTRELNGDLQGTFDSWYSGCVQEENY